MLTEESDLPYREVLRVVLESIQSTNHNVAVVAERIDILAENQVAITQSLQYPQASSKKKGFGTT